MFENTFLENIFSSILKMSLTASYVILFVMLARFCMKKLPKIYSYLLWSVVLFRLLCPFSFESSYSLIPTYEENFISNNISQSIVDMDFDYTVNTDTIENLEQEVNLQVSTTIFDVIKGYMKFIWIFGVFFIIGYNIISMINLKSKLKDVTYMYDNIYSSENIGTAFVLGTVKPKIYLPSNLNENEQNFILLHEQTHIKRLDNITILIAFLATAIHWFNPLVWIAFSLANKDMEMSCDESVIQKLGKNFNKSCKKEYAHSLLSFAVGRKLVSPLAFSEGSVNDTKQRINNIVSYKKPTLIIGVFAICLVVFIIIGFGLDRVVPIKNIDVLTLTDYGKSVVDYNLIISKQDNIPIKDAKITVSMTSNNYGGIIPSTGSNSSFGSNSTIIVNTDEWDNNQSIYDISIEDIRNDANKDYELSFVFDLGKPFSIKTPNITQPIYSRNGYIYTDSNALGFNVEDLNFEIIISDEIQEISPWENISDYTVSPIETSYDNSDKSHLEITTKQIDDITREITTYNTITEETSVMLVSSPPQFNGDDI